jgi:hypothetical protein
MPGIFVFQAFAILAVLSQHKTKHHALVVAARPAYLARAIFGGTMTDEICRVFELFV